MKCFLLLLLLGSAAFPLRADGLTGPEILAEVRMRLPVEPVSLEGFLRTREGRRNVDRRLRSQFRFGDALPSMSIALYDLAGDPVTEARIVWLERQARVWLLDAEGEPVEEALPADGVADTGLTWSDLSLDFLWWPGAVLTGRERVRTRSSHVLRVPAPPDRPDVAAVRLWVDTAALFVVRAEVLGPDGEPLRRIDVDSLVELPDGEWMVKDLLIRDHLNQRRMGIRFETVEVGETAPEIPSSP